MMKAFILAAGEGRRMRPLTENCPKPLLSVANKPLIEWQIERLKLAGITDLVINVAYLGRKIEAALGDGSSLGVSIHYSRESQPLETAGGLLQAITQGLLKADEPFLLVNGDVWCDYALNTLVASTLAPEALAHLVLVNNPEHNPQGDFMLQGDGSLSLLEPEQRGLTFSGISLIHPDLILLCPQRRDVFPLIEPFKWAMSAGRVTGEYCSDYWLDVGTPQRLNMLEQRLQQAPA